MRLRCDNRDAPVWRIRLEPADKPGKRGEVVFDGSGLAQLDALLQEAEQTKRCRVLVIESTPGVFCRGMDLEFLVAHAGEDLPVIGGEERPGIVHRLDRDTSGAMVVAKTDAALTSLQRQIAERSARRRYLALVRGDPRFERAEVDAPIGRHPTQRQKMAVIPVASRHPARPARTHLTVLERFPGTVIGVTLHPLRDGRPFGAVGGPIVHCGTTMPAGGCNAKTGKVFGAPAN